MAVVILYQDRRMVLEEYSSVPTDFIANAKMALAIPDQVDLEMYPIGDDSSPQPITTDFTVAEGYTYRFIDAGTFIEDARIVSVDEIAESSDEVIREDTTSYRGIDPLRITEEDEAPQLCIMWKRHGVWYRKTRTSSLDGTPYPDQVFTGVRWINVPEIEAFSDGQYNRVRELLESLPGS